MNNVLKEEAPPKSNAAVSVVKNVMESVLVEVEDAVVDKVVVSVVEKVVENVLLEVEVALVDKVVVSVVEMEVESVLVEIRRIISVFVQYQSLYSNIIQTNYNT